MSSNRLARGLLLGSAALYVASLTQNAFCLGSAADPARLNCRHPGLAVLAMGWMETLAYADVGPFVALPWFANFFLFLAWTFVLASRRGIAIALALVGGGLGFSFLFGRVLQVSEGGGPDPILSYGLGYWLWLGSLALAFLSAAFTRRVTSP